MMAKEQTKEFSSPHWAGVPAKGADGKPISDADRERLRFELTLWPEAIALGQKTELSSVGMWELARGIRATHPGEWREIFLSKLREMAENPEVFRPRFTGALIVQAHEKLERMISEIHPNYQLAVLGELAAYLEKRKGAKKAEYRDYRPVD